VVPASGLAGEGAQEVRRSEGDEDVTRPDVAFDVVPPLQPLVAAEADINVIDFDELGHRRPEIRHDLPAGGRRLVQKATGYLATIVDGWVTYQDGKPTDPLPGRLIRGSRRAPVPAA
jgi:hypothetical protein